MTVLARSLTAYSELAEFIDRYPRLMVLTGAGISVDSGINTYRDHEGRWLVKKPIQHAEFIADATVRQRYWTRSAVGWPAVGAAQPNVSHRALAKLEHQGHVSLLLTQNVDRLHQAAGHQKVIDLHGRLDSAQCLSCHKNESRAQIQIRLLNQNNHLAELEAQFKPDGDAAVEDTLALRTISPHCLNCGGVLMPEVVFFGGAVPKVRVEQAMTGLEQADGLLVVGSSLTVFSGYRFCRAAQRWQKPIAAINRGKTRADDMFDLKIEEDCSAVMSTFI